MDEQLNDNVVNEAQDEVAAAEEMQTVEKVESLADRVKTLSPGQLVVKRFFRSKLSMIGLVTLIFLFVFSFLGPVFRYVSPAVWEQDQADWSTGKLIETNLRIDYVDESGETQIAYEYVVAYNNFNFDGPISSNHYLGTDSSGYDVFSRLMYGGRISLTLGFVVVILETLLGVLLGGLAGYFGKWVDQLIMRIVDIFNCIPTLPIMLIISYMLDAQGVEDMARLYIMMAMLTLIGWAGVARMVRGQILYLREQEYMTAAECTGLSVRRKLFKHLLPNVLPQLIVSMTLGLGSIILTEATLGYLGLGVPPEYATWGNMINVLTKEVSYWGCYPNQWVPVGLCIVAAVLAFNFVGDGLRDAFDPKMKR
ncbi:MAG: ABC transporter permease [Clostridia bacterium]|nr:ABC transporter permease [Clostridia bacterium]